MKKTLESIFKEYNIDIRDEYGMHRNLLDVLEQMYIWLGKGDYDKIAEEIYYQDKIDSVFDEERKRGNV